MSTIAQQLSELINQKNQLAANLVSKGVDANSDETFNTLVPKVLDIPTGIELIFANHSEFPKIGESSKLYIAIDENMIYRFDTEKNIYIGLNIFDTIQSKLRE